MPQILPCLQGSEDWLKARLGRPTASEFDQILTVEFKTRTGDMFTSYVARKVAEAWRGELLPGFSGSWSTEQGELREEQARSWAVFELDMPIKTVGFVVGDDGRCGCSPDGLVGEDSGVEIKSPEAHTHVRYVMDGELPKCYAAQVHGCIYVTGRPSWTFISYRRKFPPVVIPVARDEEICKRIGEALQKFYAAFDAAFERLNELSDKKKPNPFLK